MPNPNPNTSGLKFYKTNWKHGKTKTIRVPIALADQILEYGYQLDGGKVPLANNAIALPDNLSDRLGEILVRVQANETGYRKNSAARLIKDLKKLFD
jgi:hypothetical protein